MSLGLISPFVLFGSFFLSFEQSRVSVESDRLAILLLGSSLSH